MSRQLRYRATAVLLGGFLLAAPLLVNGSASAGTEAAGRQVVFGGGGVLGLSCRSTPDVGALTVPAESTVRVVNRTGHRARLRLNGAAQTSLPDDGSTRVVFRRGTTAVTLDPDCALGDEATPVLVTAAPSAVPAPSTPDPAPAPADPAPPAGPSSGAPGGPGLPDGGAPAAPVRRPDVARPGDRPAGAAPQAAPPAMPPGGSGARVRPRDAGGARVPAPTFAGMPPGSAPRLLPGVPAVDPAAVPPVGPVPPVVPVAAAEPVAAVEAAPDPAPRGLLAAVAVVLVLGVSAATIRTIVAQRASRARFA